jgi:hypothetical protein
MTDALGGDVRRVRRPKNESSDANLARELKAVAENPNTPQMAEMTTTNQTALTGVCVE